MVEKITVAKKHYKALLQRDKQKTVTIEEKDGVIAEKEEDITEFEETVKELKDKVKTLEIENVRLKTKCNDILKEVKELRTKKTKSSTKNEQSDDISNTIHEHIKDFVYRNTKFAQTGPELKAVTNRVWNGIKAGQNLDTGEDAINFKEFNRIYGCVVQSELSLRRQYSQTRGQQAGKGMNTARS
jgi:chromosome segregation ATPase